MFDKSFNCVSPTEWWQIKAKIMFYMNRLQKNGPTNCVSDCQIHKACDFRHDYKYTALAIDNLVREKRLLLTKPSPAIYKGQGYQVRPRLKNSEGMRFALKRAVFPTVGTDEKNQEIRATFTLCNYKGKYYLVGAAHTFEDYYSIKTKQLIVTLPEDRNSYPLPMNRVVYNNELDLGLTMIPEQHHYLFNGLDVFALEDHPRSHQFYNCRKVLYFYGYPAGYYRTDCETGNYYTSDLLYYGSEIEAPFPIYLESVACPGCHVVVKFDRNKNKDPKAPDTPICAPETMGMSGGAITRAYIDGDNNTKLLELVGIYLNEYTEKLCLVGLKKEKIREYIDTNFG